KEPTRCHDSERKYHLGTNQLELDVEPLTAGPDLPSPRTPIPVDRVCRVVKDDVRDPCRNTIQSGCRELSSESLSGWTFERSTLDGLPRPGRLTHDHEGRPVGRGGKRRSARQMKRTSVARPDGGNETFSVERCHRADLLLAHPCPAAYVTLRSPD